MHPATLASHGIQPSQLLAQQHLAGQNWVGIRFSATPSVQLSSNFKGIADVEVTEIVSIAKGKGVRGTEPGRAPREYLRLTEKFSALCG